MLIVFFWENKNYVIEIDFVMYTKNLDTNTSTSKAIDVHKQTNVMQPLIVRDKITSIAVVGLSLQVLKKKKQMKHLRQRRKSFRATDSYGEIIQWKQTRNLNTKIRELKQNNRETDVHGWWIPRTRRQFSDEIPNCTPPPLSRYYSTDRAARRVNSAERLRWQPTLGRVAASKLPVSTVMILNRTFTFVLFVRELICRRRRLPFSTQFVRCSNR